MQGVIDRLQRDAKTGSISADDGRQFEFSEESLEGLDFDAVVLGTTVEFLEGITPEGGRALNVRPMAEQISASAVEALAPENNVKLDEAMSVEKVPDEIEGDEVNQPSWDSFPASDPPASGKFT